MVKTHLGGIKKTFGHPSCDLSQDKSILASDHTWDVHNKIYSLNHLLGKYNPTENRWPKFSKVHGSELSLSDSECLDHAMVKFEMKLLK